MVLSILVLIFIIDNVFCWPNIVHYDAVQESPGNGWDLPFDWYYHDHFFNGMRSTHTNGEEDRMYFWRYTRPHTIIRPQSNHYFHLGRTLWDEHFVRDCGVNALMNGVQSDHELRYLLLYMLYIVYTYSNI